MAAIDIEVFDLYYLLLVQGYLLEGGEHPLVVLCAFPEELLGDSRHGIIIVSIFKLRISRAGIGIMAVARNIRWKGARQGNNRTRNFLAAF